MQDTLELKDRTNLSRQKVTATVSEFLKGYYMFKPNPEDPDPTPWPWRQLVNKVNERVLSARQHSWTLAALNPQPLPPRIAFSIAMTEEVIERAAIMQQVSDGFVDSGEQRGIIIVGGYVQRFVDDICPERPRFKPPKFWGPWPPEPDPDPRWNGLDLAVIATIFQNEARALDQEGLRNIMNEAAEKIMQVAVARL